MSAADVGPDARVLRAIAASVREGGEEEPHSGAIAARSGLSIAEIDQALERLAVRGLVRLSGIAPRSARLTPEGYELAHRAGLID